MTTMTDPAARPILEIIAYRCMWDSGWQQYHDETDPLPKKWDDDPPDETAALVMKIDADAEINRLRAALDKIADEGCIKLPPDWRREGMVVVVDAATGQLLGCMGRAAWDTQLAETNEANAAPPNV